MFTAQDQNILKKEAKARPHVRVLGCRTEGRCNAAPNLASIDSVLVEPQNATPTGNGQPRPNN